MASNTVDPLVYFAACDSFKNAVDMLTDTLNSIQGQLEASSKLQRETLLAKSSLQTKLSQAESRLKVALDELSIQRGQRHDALSMTDRITTLQSEVRHFLPLLTFYCHFPPFEYQFRIQS